MREDWTFGRRTERSRLAALSAVSRAGGDITAFDDPRARSAIYPARLIALAALIAVLLAVVAILVTSPVLSKAGSSVVVVRSSPVRRTSVAAADAPSTFAESPSFTLPFPPNRADRPTRPGEVPSLYADGLPCSIGCRPYGAQTGWPLAPFHHQHPIRASLNELRPGSLHVGVDIQTWDGARVYAVQPGVAEVLDRYGSSARVQVGSYIYWHINPKVTTGELVTPFKTVLGTVMVGYGHMAFSEIGADGQYANPLRPVGSVLRPYLDQAAPVIGTPSVSSDGQVVVSAYDPQTFIRKTTYFTPVLAPAALAYRLYDSHGVPVTPLEWSFRGTHLLRFAQRLLIYAPGAQAPGFDCFASRSVCIPQWSYRVADGLAPPLPTTLALGPYRLTIYAWDWADNTTALDTTLTLTSSGWKPKGHLAASLFTMPGYLERNLLLPPTPPAGQGLAPSLYPTASQALPLPPSYATPPRATGQQPPATTAPQSPGTATGGQQSPPASSPPTAPTGGQAPTGSPAK